MGSTSGLLNWDLEVSIILKLLKRMVAANYHNIRRRKIVVDLETQRTSSTGKINLKMYLLRISFD